MESQREHLGTTACAHAALGNLNYVGRNFLRILKPIGVHGLIALGAEPLSEEAGDREIARPQAAFEVPAIDSDDFGRLWQLVQFSSAMRLKQNVHSQLEGQVRQTPHFVGREN